MLQIEVSARELEEMFGQQIGVLKELYLAPEKKMTTTKLLRTAGIKDGIQGSRMLYRAEEHGYIYRTQRTDLEPVRGRYYVENELTEKGIDFLKKVLRELSLEQTRHRDQRRLDTFASTTPNSNSETIPKPPKR